MKNRCIATSPEAFIRQVMASYLPNGYHYYVAGHVPDRFRHQPERIDQVLSQKYSTNISKSVRSGRRADGHASIRYLRHSQFWILVCTQGQNSLKRTHRYVNHFGKRPLTAYGYSIRLVGRKPMAYVQREEYRQIKESLLSICVKERYRNPDYMAATIRNMFPFEPYAGVIQQFALLLRQINRKRGRKRITKIPLAAVTLRRSSSRGPRITSSESVLTAFPSCHIT